MDGSVGILPASPSRPHVGAARADPGLAGSLDPRSSLGDRGPHGGPAPGDAKANGGPEAYHRSDVVRFLRVLLRTLPGTLPGKLLIIWDGAPIHRGQPIKDFLARGAAKRIHLEHLPGYAPDRTPVDGIWTYLKCRELGNVCCRTFAELDTALRRAKERLRHKRQVIRGSIAECGYRF